MELAEHYLLSHLLDLTAILALLLGYSTGFMCRPRVRELAMSLKYYDR